MTEVVCNDLDFARGIGSPIRQFPEIPACFEEILMATRQCPFCGMLVSDYLPQCPFCREALTQVRLANRTPIGGHGEIRQGLLYMLLAGIIHYFAGGYSAMSLPLSINPAVAEYLSPLVFSFGLGLSLHGSYVHRKARTHSIRVR